MDAVCAKAGLSKGGFLHHFPTKESLVEALAARLIERSAQELKKIEQAPEGAALSYIRSSALVSGPINRTTLAAMSLAAQGHDVILAALREVDDRARALIVADVGDPAVGEVFALIGDGIYSTRAMRIGTSEWDGATDEPLYDVAPVLHVLRALLDSVNLQATQRPVNA
jgi:AcrR family transcriptional regulator